MVSHLDFNLDKGKRTYEYVELTLNEQFQIQKFKIEFYTISFK